MMKLRDKLVKEILSENDKNWLLKLIKIALLGNSGQKVVLLYRLSKYFDDNKMSRLSMFLLRRLEKTYGVYISPNATIGVGLKLPHPTGIVIGSGVEIGLNCTIFHQVTLGGARLGDAQNNFYPKVGDNVIFFAGAKIIGKISIGSNCVVGANSVVVKNVPAGCTVVGVPARIIRERENNARR